MTKLSIPNHYHPFGLKWSFISAVNNISHGKWYGTVFLDEKIKKWKVYENDDDRQWQIRSESEAQ